MRIQLIPSEARVLGALIEKEITTPDQYPLSLNALTSACNQKSNRDPVMSLTETEVRDIVDGLIKKRLVKEISGYGSRVVKFKHWFCNTEFGDLKFSEQELGIVCVLFLRGPQTPGELRSRTNRLCEFSDVQAVDATLINLMNREDGPFVVKLEREPGKRESRYAHLFCGEVEVPVPVASEPQQGDDQTNKDQANHDQKNHAQTNHDHKQMNYENRIAQLEGQVFELQKELAQIKTALSDLLD